MHCDYDFTVDHCKACGGEVKDGKWTKWKKVKTAKSTSKSWTDKKAVSGTKYKYIVKAQKGEYKSYYKVSNKLVYTKAQ